MDEKIFSVIRDYRRNNCKPDDYTNVACFRNWALDELMMELMDSQDETPEDILFFFNMQMRMYEVTEQNMNLRLAYGVATEVSEDIAKLYSKEAL